VREFIDNEQPWPAGQCRIEVEFAQGDAAVVHLEIWQLLEAFEQRLRLGAAVRLDHADDDVDALLAALARGNGASHFSIVSALGASRASPFFYSRVKGEVEEGLRAMDWPSLAIFRPSVIAGDRGESRPLERVSAHLLRLAPSTWRPVAASDIAAAMVATALRSPPGVTVVESRHIVAAAAPG